MLIHREGEQLLFQSEDGKNSQHGTVHLDLAMKPHRIRLEQLGNGSVKVGSIFGIYKWISQSNTQERPDWFIMLVQEKDYPNATDLEKEDGDRYEFERESLKPEPALPDGRYQPSDESTPADTLTPNPSPRGRGEPEGAASVKVFALQHAQATEVAEVLKQVYDKGPAKIVPDARTNSVIVTGPEAQLREIEALLLKLDEGGRQT